MPGNDFGQYTDPLSDPRGTDVSAIEKIRTKKDAARVAKIQQRRDAANPETQPDRGFSWERVFSLLLLGWLFSRHDRE